MLPNPTIWKRHFLGSDFRRRSREPFACVIREPLMLPERSKNTMLCPGDLFEKLKSNSEIYQNGQ